MKKQKLITKYKVQNETCKELKEVLSDGGR